MANRETNTFLKKHVGRIHTPTVTEIISDRLTKLSLDYWAPSTSGNEEIKPFDPKIIEDIYYKEILQENNLSRVMLLELSLYLEHYLWPNFDSKKSSFSHLMSLIVMVNEKFRENVPAWQIFHQRESEFSEFIEKVLDLTDPKERDRMSIQEKTWYIIFIINAFQSLEDETIRKHGLRLLSLASWKSLNLKRVQHELKSHPKLSKQWNLLQDKNEHLNEVNELNSGGPGGKKRKRAAKKVLVSHHEQYFIASLIEMFLQVVNSVSVDNQIDRWTQLFCERFLELMIDLISQLPTRRFFHLILQDTHLVVRARMSEIPHIPEGRLFCQLLDILEFYEFFEIDNYTGVALTHDQMSLLHCDRLFSFQRLCFKWYPELREFSLSNVGSIETRDTLLSFLEPLDSQRLRQLATDLFLVSDQTQRCTREFLMEVFAYRYKKRSYQIDAINEEPLYPTEEVLWDENVVPILYYTGEGCLALPKLNLQFLTFHDYLLRNYQLFRGEATYELREDISDAVSRVQGRNLGHRTEFNGWARMALPIKKFGVTRVAAHNIGENKPSEVVGEITVTLSNVRGNVRDEWEHLRLHDILYLLTIRPPQKPSSTSNSDSSEGDSSSLPFPQQYGVVAARGCEVMCLLDEDGKVIDERSPISERKGTLRTIRVWLDNNQYQKDLNTLGDDLYNTFNLVVRRKPKENNFKAILETIRDLMNTQFLVPNWLHDVFLGYGDPGAANQILSLSSIDFRDTFLDLNHVFESFPQQVIRCYGERDKLVPPFKLTFLSQSQKETNDSLSLSTLSTSLPVNPSMGLSTTISSSPLSPALSLPHSNVPPSSSSSTAPNTAVPVSLNTPITSPLDLLPGKPSRRQKKKDGEAGSKEEKSKKKKKKELEIEILKSQNLNHGNINDEILVESYVPLNPGPYPQNKPKQNQIRFTPTQISAIKSGLNHGLTLVVGPPGTGKTDVAVQIIANLYHNCPEQRTLLVTHSNQALNQLFEKLLALDIKESDLLRLGHGEELLETEKNFSKYGRVNFLLSRRLDLLAEVKRLVQSLDTTDDPEVVGETCENASHFFLYHVVSRWEEFLSIVDPTSTTLSIPSSTPITASAAAAAAASSSSSSSSSASSNGSEFERKVEDIERLFPFNKYFSNAPQPLFKGQSWEEDMDIAIGCMRQLTNMFRELDECRAFEILRSAYDRANYLLIKQAKIIAMTCTHAALKRRDLVALGFKYENVVMEESAQILEIETFIPMLLQKQELNEECRLKRVILIGDHNQLPPVIKNVAFQKYAHLDQSLFTRFVRLGVPSIELDQQGRCRPSIADLFNWRYKRLGNLESVVCKNEYVYANPGLLHEFQVINVNDYEGRGESEPTPFFYQNLGEAEYVVALFQYLRLLGYPAEKISIITSYNGQKSLIRDVVEQRCSRNPLFGRPRKITTVDKFQGQQNDFILLSLVRTKTVGHIRDVRRLVVAMSRARLGLYVFCRRSLFENCYELTPAFSRLLDGGRRSDKLQLVQNEFYHHNQSQRRLINDIVPSGSVYQVEDLIHMGAVVNQALQTVHTSHNIPSHPPISFLNDSNSESDPSSTLSTTTTISSNFSSEENPSETSDAIEISNNSSESRPIE